MIFQSYEIRPCVKYDGNVVSFLGEPAHCPKRGANIYTPKGAEMAAAKVAEENSTEVFWTLYGWNGAGHDAIGDFTTFDAALSVLNGILAPMAQARDLLAPCADGDPGGISDAWSLLEDVINQSSTGERL